MVAFLLIACISGILAAMWEYATLGARPKAASGPQACGSCGYERTGLASGVVCPECGSSSVAGGRSLDIAGYWWFIHALLAAVAMFSTTLAGGVGCLLAFLPLSGFGKALARRGDGKVAERVLTLGTGAASAAMIGAGVWTFETCRGDALSLGLGILLYVPMAGLATALWSIPIGHFLLRRPSR